MEKSAVFLALMLIAAVSPAFALPDLQVRSLEYSSDAGRVIAVIENTETDQAAGPVTVQFYDGDEQIGQAIYSGNLPGIGTAAVYIDHTLEEGRHSLRAVADPEGRTAETNENNNQRSLSLVYTSGSSQIPVVPVNKGESFIAQNLGLYLGTFFAVAVAVLAVFLKLRSGHGASPGAPSMPKPPQRMESYKPRRETRKEKHEGKKMEFFAKAAAVFALLGSGLRRKKAPHETAGRQEEEKPEEEHAGLMKIRDITGMPKGSRVKFSAQLVHYDKIGGDHAYFLKDSTDEIIGFSKELASRQDGVISGTTDHFLDNTVVMIEKIE